VTVFRESDTGGGEERVWVLHPRDGEMNGTSQDRHRCQNPRCRKSFAVVYHRSCDDVQIPLAVACPRCGRWGVVMVSAGAVSESPGTWVLPVEHSVAALGA